MSVKTVSLWIFLFFTVSVSAETPIPSAPTRWATDTAGFLSPQTVSTLDAQLEAYERATGHQILVYIGATTEGVPIEDWAVRAFEAWKVGRKGIDDGLVLFIMAQDRRLRIEVGYGLETQMTDAIASRIIDEIMVPRIRTGNPDDAVTAGIAAITGVLGGSDLPAPQRSRNTDRPNDIGTIEFIFGGIAVLLFVILAITNPRLAVQLLVVLASRGHHGGVFGGGRGGGGFGGGGGRSGGGGASGSW